MQLSRFFSLPKYSEMASSIYPGMAVAVVTALAAASLASHYQTPVMLFALLLGLSLHFLSEVERFMPGLNWAAQKLLRMGVALLGVRIAVDDMMSLGWQAPSFVLLSMISVMIFGVVLAKALGLSREMGILSGGSVAVCGVSAAAAFSSVIPKKSLGDNEFVLTVVSVTALSTMAMILYPIITGLLNLPDDMAGVFIGGSIHDVAQVVGAGYTISPEAGDTATYVKLLRVAMLLPLVVVVFLLIGDRQEQGGEGTSLLSCVPVFLIGFVFFAVINNLGWVAEPVSNGINHISRAFLVISISAIGIKTSLKAISTVGWKPIVLIVAETAFLAAMILVGIIWLI